MEKPKVHGELRPENAGEILEIRNIYDHQWSRYLLNQRETEPTYEEARTIYLTRQRDKIKKS